MASSAIYRDLLLKHRHGLPLWIPDPDENLEEHKKQGISIGDLGLLTEDGGFEYLFNIHVDADHSVNKDMVIPPSFTPLPLPRTSKHAYHDQKACITQNARFDIGGTIAAGVNLGPGAGVEVELDFTTTDERAAMLYLPHGADREDTTARGLYRNTLPVWRIVVQICQRRARLRRTKRLLVSGDRCDKSGSWALAAGAPQTGSSVQFKIRAGPLAVAAVTEGFHVSWSNTGGVERRHYPPSMKDSVEVKNQCVFVRGLTIAIRTSWFTKPLRGKVEINEINTSTQSFPGAGKTYHLDLRHAEFSIQKCDSIVAA
ncbi:hypothetical protein BJ912DRAFT_100426 [Pholiota molesta]|nr:hypothetical protein BJ912DRAFT_100426 [Pholiota molesta]